MRTYSLYLNTKTANGFLKPIDKSNLNCVKWSVNWEALFSTSMNARRYLNPNFKCKLKIQFVSSGGLNINWAGHKGTVRINGLVSSSQNLNDNLILGVVRPALVPVHAGGTEWYLECDTTQSQGVEISLPSNPVICIGLYNDAGNLMVNSLEYEVILHFELEDDTKETDYLQKSS